RHRVGDRGRDAVPAAVQSGDDGGRMSGTTIDALRDVPLFADLDGDELARVASVFKERRFADGETVIQQGSGAAAFFVIDSGAARATSAVAAAAAWAQSRFSRISLARDQSPGGTAR